MRRAWSDADLRTLREQFADSRTDDLAMTLGRTYRSVAQVATKLGLKKSAAYLAGPLAHRFDGKKGSGSRFEKGLIPWNKGKEYKAGGRSVETQFKPGACHGRAAQIVAPLGAYRINPDGILEQKFGDTPGLQTMRWRAVHRIVWEAANGPTPAGHVVVFKPGRRTTEAANIALDALELVSRADLMHRNSVHTKYPPELARVVQLRGAIQRQINKRASNES